MWFAVEFAMSCTRAGEEFDDPAAQK